jgi:hypothetical protein
MFAKKVVLTKRVRWFEDSNSSPSFNHCWMIWDRQHRGPPTIAYDVKSTASDTDAHNQGRSDAGPKPPLREGENKNDDCI